MIKPSNPASSLHVRHRPAGIGWVPHGNERALTAGSAAPFGASRHGSARPPAPFAAHELPFHRWGLRLGPAPVPGVEQVRRRRGAALHHARESLPGSRSAPVWAGRAPMNICHCGALPGGVPEAISRDACWPMPPMRQDGRAQAWRGAVRTCCRQGVSRVMNVPDRPCSSIVSSSSPAVSPGLPGASRCGPWPAAARGC
jgi:hypothetical protein